MKMNHLLFYVAGKRRLCWLLAGLLALTTSSAIAQPSVKRWPRPNVVKTNLLAPVSVFYERALTQRFALQANVRWFNRAESRFVNAAIEGRFYMDGRDALAKKPHPAGFYAGPYLKARSLHYVNQLGQGAGQPVARDEVVIQSIGFGAVVGYQGIVRRGFVVDSFIGGGAMPFTLSRYRHTMRYSTVTSDVGYDYYAMDIRAGISLGYAF